MPVSKHRHRSDVRLRKRAQVAPITSQRDNMTIDELRQAIADPALDFPAKTVIAGIWWFQNLLLKAGDRWQSIEASRKDKNKAALLLCVAMDGEPGKNDDLSPIIADMLRPYSPAPTFAEGWEQAKQMPPGTVRATVAKLLSPFGNPVA